MKFENNLKKTNLLSKIVIGKAIDVHKKLGSGLFESLYQKCLLYELQKENITAAMEVPIPIKYYEKTFKMWI